ncbi:SEC7-like protein [Hortaea werneckii]|nr:SEC7-like protein [Hortaea werneckii]
MDGRSRSAAGPSSYRYLSSAGNNNVKRTPPLPLSKRTSSRQTLNKTFFDAADSPPSTPPPVPRDRRSQRGKSKEATQGAPVPRRREQLIRDDEVAAERNRHSHGLSWSSGTRDSVVDNLLQSLGSLSGQDPSGMDDVHDEDFDREKYRMPDFPALPSLIQTESVSRPRGHTHSSSTSSGYAAYGTVAAQSPSSKYSQTTKGRRSHSSSNFGYNSPITGRGQSARKMSGTGRMSSETQKYVGNSGQSSKEDGNVASLDRGYRAVMQGSKPKSNSRRSMSMDQIDRIHAQPPVGSSVLARGRPVPSVYSRFEGNYDAAPEPGIPAGPRKKEDMKSKGPVFVNQAPPKSVRKANTQSDLRNTSRTGPEIPQHIQDQASNFVRLSSMKGNSSVSLQKDVAQAPSPAFKTARKDAASPHRERPGFFRRVFLNPGRMGSVSHESLGYLDKAMPPSRSHSHEPATQLRQSTKENQPPSQPPPSLSKKTSSFFRRRKQSVSEPAQAPPLPLNASLNSAAKPTSPSHSASSLRQVMDPYLSKDDASAATDAVAHGRNTPTAKRDLSSRPTSKGYGTEDSSDLDIFHSGYSPPPDASLGRRDPFSRRTNSRSELPKPGPEPQESPRMKIKVKRRRSGDAERTLSHDQSLEEQTFLHDASRVVSAATVGDEFTLPFEQPKVSPLSEAAPGGAHFEGQAQDAGRPVSRASTGDRIIAAGAANPDDVKPPPMRSFSDGADVTQDTHDDGWVITRPAVGDGTVRPSSKRSERLYLEPNEFEEGVAQASKENMAPSVRLVEDLQDNPAESHPQEMTPPSVPSVAQLPLPSVQIEGEELPRKSTDTATPGTTPNVSDVNAEYKERARRIFEGDEEDVVKSEAASWLGEKTTLSTHTLEAYMQLFEFANMNILGALRTLCGKLLLKGETQQFDRIITALSARWCACNPNHGFKAQDVVHTIFYSVILLNTDLHLADIGEKMSKNAYVKNTLPTIRRVVADAAPNAFDDSTIKASQSATRPTLPWTDSMQSIPKSPSSQQPDTPTEKTSFEELRPTDRKRGSIRPAVFRSESDGWIPDSTTSSSSMALVSQPWSGNMRAWEFEIEAILKSFYSSIKSEPLPLLGTMASDAMASDRNLSAPNVGNGLKRTGSTVSRAPSDNVSFRSKPGFRTMTSGWQNRINRSRPKLYPASTIGSSRTSLDDNSVWSTTMSSKNSFAKTLTSTSVNSLGHHMSPVSAEFKHSIGFANALSQAIIREEAQSTSAIEEESMSVPAGLLEDEALTLEGAPWAKEGLVKHKHHMESPDRKAKDRNWTDCFAVISKGKLTLFAFNTSSTRAQSAGRKAQQKNAANKGSSVTATKVGGGDWMENAEQLDYFVLRQTIASTLPPPGYSKTRPHVWALSLPSGAVHLFQVGTPEIAKEFMTSANYWSARLSKEPLSGGVSNIEYGWSDQVINPAVLERTESFSSPPGSMNNPTRHMHSSSGGGNLQRRGSGTAGRPSFQSSLRGSFDTGFGSVKAKTPGDRVQIADWHPPTQSMMASQLMEVDQLTAVTEYVTNVENELAKHMELKHGIELAYSPRHHNYAKAMSNWQRKSDYLLREIVKFRTYMDALNAAERAKDAFYARKAEQELAKGAVGPVDSGSTNQERDSTPLAPQTAG